MSGVRGVYIPRPFGSPPCKGKLYISAGKIPALRGVPPLKGDQGGCCSLERRTYSATRQEARANSRLRQTESRLPAVFGLTRRQFLRRITTDDKNTAGSHELP